MMKFFEEGIRYLRVALIGGLLLMACRALSPSREAADHSAIDGSAMHDESSTTVSPDLWTVAQEVKEVRNTVTSQTTHIIGETKTMGWIIMGVLSLNTIQNIFLQKKKR